jgi:hypothetical protein
MAFFGKRASPSRSAAGSTDTQPPRQKILPDEVWQGEIGNMLRTLGMSPDDEQNLVPTPASIDARIARDKAAHEARWAALNRDIGAKTNVSGVFTPSLICRYLNGQCTSVDHQRSWTHVGH